MADLGISEFTFGYAFISEQIRKRWGNVVSVPIFPSLIKERGLGYDVELPLKGKTCYYQFKTSELLKSANSKFIRDGTYTGEYYRIKLHKMFNNNQHRMLWKLSQKEKNTYYVAPECSNLKVFNDAFLNGKVTDYSRLIPLKNCNNYADSDSNQHYITYQEGNPAFYQHSEVSEKKESILGKNIGDLYNDMVKDFKTIDSQLSDEILSNVLEFSIYSIDKELLDYELLKNLSVKTETTYDKLSLAANILWALHGILMVMIGEESKG